MPHVCLEDANGWFSIKQVLFDHNDTLTRFEFDVPQTFSGKTVRRVVYKPKRDAVTKTMDSIGRAGVGATAGKFVGGIPGAIIAAFGFVVQGLLTADGGYYDADSETRIHADAITRRDSKHYRA